VPKELMEQTRRTEDLAASDRGLATFIDAFPALAWIANADGWIFWYNRRWYEYTGNLTQEIEGRGWQKVHHPDALPAVMERWTKSIRTGESFETVFQLRGADGVFRSFLTPVVPLKDETGKVLRWFGTNAEIDELQRTREELEASEAQFRQIAEYLPQLVWVTRPDGYHEWYNQRWYDYTGTTPEQCVGTGWSGLFHPEDQERARIRWQHSLATGEPYNIEYRCRRYDGSYRWFLGSALPLRNGEGTIVRWFGTCTDIHRLREGEQERILAEQRIRVALANVPLILFTIDRDLRYTWIHRSHEKFFIADLIGRTDAEIDPSGALQPLTDFKQTIIRLGMAERREVRLEIHGVPEIYDISAEPLRDAAGDVTGATIAALNITERALVEQELREKSEFIDLIQTAVNAGYWSYFPETEQLYLSPGEQALFGVSNSRLSLDALLLRVHPEDRAHVATAMRAAIDSSTYVSEFRVETSSGSYRWLAAQGSTLTRASGERYLVGINIDVTERKLVAETLIQSEKLAAVGRLASSIAHEINNPLEAVTNLLYLARGTEDMQTVQEYLEMAEREVRRVSAIANQTLRFHKQSSNPTCISSQMLLADALAIYQGRLANSSIHVEKRGRTADPITCFEGEIRQVLANLIGNAVDAMSVSGGRLLLRTREAADWATGRRGVMITVADTGGGIPLESQQKVFNAFFTTKGISGTGLGLWVSNEIVARHRGSLRFRTSLRPGHSGTVFCLFLPFDAVTR
jgi:two-component system, sporulation sensor kinase E